MTSDAPSTPPAVTTPQATTAFAVALVALVLYAAAMIFAGDDDDSAAGLLWPLSGLTGATAAYLAWKAGAPRQRGRALAALVIGGLLFALILGWVVVAAFTGDL